jgi:hypothetical protein
MRPARTQSELIQQLAASRLSRVILSMPMESSYRISPGCFSAADTLDEALTNGQEAILLHIEGLLDDGKPKSPEGTGRGSWRRTQRDMRRPPHESRFCLRSPQTAHPEARRPPRPRRVAPHRLPLESQDVGSRRRTRAADLPATACGLSRLPRLMVLQAGPRS